MPLQKWHKNYKILVICVTEDKLNGRKIVNIFIKTYRLAVVHYAHTSLSHNRMELLPWVSSVSWAVDGACLRLDKDNIVRVSTPHDVDEGAVDFEDLEVNLVCVGSIDLNHCRCSDEDSSSKCRHPTLAFSEEATFCTSFLIRLCSLLIAEHDKFMIKL